MLPIRKRRCEIPTSAFAAKRSALVTDFSQRAWDWDSGLLAKSLVVGLLTKSFSVGFVTKRLGEGLLATCWGLGLGIARKEPRRGIARKEPWSDIAYKELVIEIRDCFSNVKLTMVCLMVVVRPVTDRQQSPQCRLTEFYTGISGCGWKVP